MAQNKQKPNIDSIHKPVIAQLAVEPTEDKPLLSILEPETEKPVKIEKKNKTSWLFRDLFRLEDTKKLKKGGAKKSSRVSVENPVTTAGEKTKKRPLIKPHHKKIAASLFIFGIVLCVGVFVAGAAYAHQSLYKNKVYPGVVVWGNEVGGESMTEVQQLISGKINNYKINLTGPDQTYSATANDLGLVFDSETMALSAYSKGRTSSFWDNYFTRAKLMVASINWGPIHEAIRANDLEIRPTYQVDNAKLDEYINKISANINIAAKDSEVKIINGNTQLVPAIYGREVVKEKLKNNLNNYISGLKTAELRIETKQIKPAVIDNSAQEVAIQAKNVMARPVVLTYKGQTFRPDSQTVGSWITFVKPKGAQNYTLVIDPSRMKNYFTFLGTKLNIYSVPKKVQVENGNKETVLQEGKDGLLIDETALGRSIAATLPIQSSVNVAIPMYVSKFKTQFNQILVADWDKYIDLNISTQTMTAYLKGGQVVGSWKVTTGNKYHPTPTGTFLVYGKSPITRMTGGTPGVDYYDLPNVHWVTWFHGGYSIHEAYWRTVFGGSDYVWNGSHGCVNATYALAKFIYDWAPKGTPVVIHY